jgi:hypothetical protein
MDWTPLDGGLQLFWAVLCWSRYRFVRLSGDQKLETTLALLLEDLVVPKR